MEGATTELQECDKETVTPRMRKLNMYFMDSFAMQNVKKGHFVRNSLTRDGHVMFTISIDNHKCYFITGCQSKMTGNKKQEVKKINDKPASQAALPLPQR